MRGDQLARQWLLIQRLARSRAGCTLDELAAELQCVRRTVYRDLDALMLAGFPLLQERRDGRQRWRFIETFRLGDVPFTTDELMALAFGEDLLRVLEGTVFHDSVCSALRKIRGALSPDLAEFLARLGESFRVMPGPHKRYAAHRLVIQGLNDAVLGRRSVEIRHRTGGTGPARSRAIDPYRVFYRSGGLYVVGRDHRSGEIRTFALDRIDALARTEQRFSVPRDFDFDAWLGASFGVIAEPAVHVRVRFDPRWAAWVAERTWHASQRTRWADDGGLELAMDVGGTAELRSWVLSFGGGAEVLEPAHLREEVRAELASGLARYESVPATRAAGAKRRATAPALRPRG